ncbi:CIC11C00000005681 [Sungouiella intermedia]|uniref:CIC11C00000005681 n=1 Tax=Sungouiella intermedia TaxID=45354 RepID=A0A1L0D413_9ASCO|nr:CIC11C00000005681 [[Candida] intermedia]
MNTSAKPTLVSIRSIESFSQIADAMAHVFQDAQMTLSGHRKLVVLLRCIQVRAISIGYEEMFNFQFIKLISKILKLRKGVPAADRIAKFCSVVVATILKEEADKPTPRPNGDVSDEGEPLESVSSEFVDNLIRHLLRGIESKFKEVRYRVVQLLAYLVNYITEIDEQLFKALRYSLNRRLYDREPIVRIQAVVAISRFQYFQENDEDVNSATKSLLVSLRHDDSPEVRRAALLNLVKTKDTLPDILERARDTNAINRRLVYSRILREITSFSDVSVDVRDQLLSWGLNDRDSSVKAAAENMFSKTWLALANEDILELIENLRVIDSEVAETAMTVLYELKRDKLDGVEISAQTWKELTVERAFFIRTYFEFCNHQKLYDNIEKNIPELTRMALMLQQYLKLRSSMLSSNKELVEKHMAHERKLDKFTQLLKNTNAELLEFTRKVTKETAYIQQLSVHVNEFKEKIQTKKNQMTKFNDRMKKAPSDTLKHEVEELRMEIKTLETESQESQSALDQYEITLEQHKERLKELSKIVHHQSSERDAYIEASGDFEVEYGPFGEQLQELEFIIEQLLLIIKGSDFADVAGTRRLMPIITNALTHDILTDKLISISVRILRRISIDESYFSSLCTEIITDIRDSASDENDETFVSAVSIFEGNEDEADDDDEVGERDMLEKRRKLAPALPADELLIQCLMVLQHYLENVEDTQSNIHQLDSMIDTLIRPAISNNLNPTIRLLGYTNLGLFSLIDKGLGTSNLKFFGMSASKSPDEQLKVLSTKILFDVLSTHGVGILSDEGDDSVDSLSLARLFYSLLKSYEMPALQAVVAEGLCKLFLADLLVDFGKGELRDSEDESSQEMQLLDVLMLSYFHPLNADNHELKQTLAFCIPVYAFSHANHQGKISSVSGDCFYRIFRSDSDLARYDNLSGPATVIQQLIYWGDPNNLVNATEDEIRKSTSHFWQAMKFLQVIEQESSKAVKKVVIQNLSKLSITEELGSELLSGLKSAIDDTRRLISDNQQNEEFIFDAATEKAMDKFQVFVGELVKKALDTEAAIRARTPVRSRSNSVSVKVEATEDVRAEGSNEKEMDKREDEDDNGEMELKFRESNLAEILPLQPVVANRDADDADFADVPHVNSANIDNTDTIETNDATLNIHSQAIPAKPVVPDLDEIDQFLDAEDQVEYDISME